MSSSVLASAATAATYNMILQLMLRLVTFVLNAFVLRHISKDLLGVVNVRLMLLYSTILFLSREAFRRACLNKATVEKQWSQLINLVWFIIPIGAVCSCVFGYIWAYVLEQPDPSSISHYRLAVVFIAVSALVELLSEPLFITSQILLYVRLKVVVEGLAINLRCALTVTMVMLWPDRGVLNFCVAQLCFSLAVTGMLYLYFTLLVYRRTEDSDLPFKSVRDFFPKMQTPFISMGLASLTWSFVQQSFLKQILNEGERYVMTIFAVIKLSEQGIFDVVTNLGSLAGRFIFLPLEDSGYLFFSQTLVRGKSAVEQDKKALELSVQVLESLLKLVSWLGLTIMCFGYSYSFLLLDLYGGTIISSGVGPTLLKWFCVYVVMMAINGITECFAAATMSQQQLDRFNQRVLASSLLYLVYVCFMCQIFGTVGLILGNCLNYVVRISFSAYHIREYFQGTNKSPLESILPNLKVAIVMFLCWSLTAFSEALFCCDTGLVNRVIHVCFGGLCLLALVFTTYLSERRLIQFVLEQYHARKQKVI